MIVTWDQGHEIVNGGDDDGNLTQVQVDALGG